jgi:hypothetical protein
MRCPADRAAYTQVKDQRTSELAPSVKARPITGPLGPIPDVSSPVAAQQPGMVVCRVHAQRFQEAARQSAHRLTDLLTRLLGTGETTRDTGDTH